MQGRRATRNATVGIRKTTRTQARLLLDWAPPRVWMEALEARTLLSGLVSDGREVRPGYFTEWGPGSYAGDSELNLYTNPLWVDQNRFKGAVMSLWGAAPDVQRVYVRVPGSYSYLANDPKTPAANRWQIASIVDVPGPTFEIHADMLLPEMKEGEILRTKVALVNDYGGDSYSFNGPMLVHGDGLVPFRNIPINRWPVSDDAYRLSNIEFFDRQIDATQYKVTLDFGEGRIPKTYEVTSTPNGSTFRSLSLVVPTHELQEGKFTITVTTEDGSNTLTGEEQLTLPWEKFVPPVDERLNQLGWNWQLETLYQPVSRSIDKLDAVFVNTPLTPDTTFTITWSDGSVSQATVTPSDMPNGFHELYSLEYAYALHFPAHEIQPGMNSIVIRSNGGSSDLSIDAFVIGIPQGLWKTTYGINHFNAREGELYEYSPIQFTDEVGHDISEYTAWIELEDGTRHPAHLQPEWTNSFAQNWSVIPDVVFWSPWDRPFDQYSIKPLIPAIWVIQRDGEELRFDAPIHIEEGDWIEPADAESLYRGDYDSVPQLASVAWREATRLSETSGTVRFPLHIEPNVNVSQLTASMRWDLEDDRSTPATIIRNADGTYAVEASYDLGQGWRYSHVELQWRGQPLNSMSMRTYVGQETVFTDNAYAYPWDFYLKPDFDWAGPDSRCAGHASIWPIPQTDPSGPRRASMMVRRRVSSSNPRMATSSG